ncbi:exopolysaccharide biosynthesis polyprenyl glycosylphosphotransferase [Leptospira adleri]|uniref:exopolysaccharide biosynthesis polyprenyl glycosylphosphotransferase n=1 Tax=Leptospira adleri TaxID=2023186 RepID=UPI001082593C|nr:exopolysaccharide biosynthesis polyprenyl glycosylphosphotransferase [Leptospira adleri]TGM56527.1 exopolysaccharide biosynthesis polyprenyl glycosylphosphotransferase [Leptospira adleri]
MKYERRHSKIHERLFLSLPFQYVTGWFLVLAGIYVALGFVSDWNEKAIYHEQNFNSAFGALFSFSVAVFSLRKILRFPVAQSSAYIIPIVTLSFSIVILFFFFNRSLYSSQVLTVAYFITLIWCFTGYFIGHRYSVLKIAYIPLGSAKVMENTHGAEFFALVKPSLKEFEYQYNAVVGDLVSEELTPEWEKFLAKCTLSGIPVYHIKQIKEALTGRVKINHLSENEFGSLLPSQFYGFLKRLIDLIASLVLIPLVLPILIVVVVLIRIESAGPAVFRQKRMGYRGKIFTMYKFRSMYTDSRGQGFTEGPLDPRITRVGKVIRKYRIDELPQLFNVLLGSMSFIGPRPESYELSQWYESEVPFFSYRHIVRPGITGWAQVEQGYAAEVEGMNVKLEYDFYYIKHFSFWLDMLIAFKTIKTILTGFGAR